MLFYFNFPNYKVLTKIITLTFWIATELQCYPIAVVSILTTFKRKAGWERKFKKNQACKKTLKGTFGVVFRLYFPFLKKNFDSSGIGAWFRSGTNTITTQWQTSHYNRSCDFSKCVALGDMCHFMREDEAEREGERRREMEEGEKEERKTEAVSEKTV